jgi:hypothetical protein
MVIHLFNNTTNPRLESILDFLVPTLQRQCYYVIVVAFDVLVF